MVLLLYTNPPPPPHTHQHPLVKKLGKHYILYGHTQKDTKFVCDGKQLLTKRYQFFDISHKNF
jgi:hypothetical protein